MCSRPDSLACRHARQAVASATEQVKAANTALQAAREKCEALRNNTCAWYDMFCSWQADELLTHCTADEKSRYVTFIIFFCGCIQEKKQC